MEPNKPQLSLEDLLQVKRAERPSAEFWENFEKDFQRRRLRALVSAEPESRSIAFRLFRASLVWAPVAVAAVVVGALMLPTPEVPAGEAPRMADASAVTFAAAPAALSPRTGEVVAGQAVPLEGARFVLDALGSSSPSERFREQMHSPALRYSGANPQLYVRDSLSSRAAGFVTASMSGEAQF